MTQLRIEYIPLDACLAMRHPENPKAHAVEDLMASFARFGFTSPPAIDEETSVLVAGHGRCKALRQLRNGGSSPPAGIGSEWLVPVIRGLRFASPAERDAYIVADNQLAISQGWDDDKLRPFLERIGKTSFGFSGLGFEKADIAALLAGPDKDPNEVTETDMPDIPTTPVAKLGDVWVLGRHILVCGDSTLDGPRRAVDAAKAPVGLVWTDPPWNVAINAVEKPSGRGATKPRANRTIMNDDLGEKFPAFVKGFIDAFTSVSTPGVQIYLAMSVQEWGLIDAKLQGGGWHWSSTIIWSKDVLVLGRKDYHSQYEPIWYGWLEGGPRRVQLADRKQSDVWPFPRPKRSEEHPTMKPVALVARAIANSSRPGDLVLDSFGGSGTTLLAAEQLDRRAALVELDPRYVDVIIQRWETLSGGKAVRA